MPSKTLLMQINDLSLAATLAGIRTHVSGVAPTGDYLKDALLTELPHRGLETDTSGDIQLLVARIFIYIYLRTVKNVMYKRW